MAMSSVEADQQVLFIDPTDPFKDLRREDELLAKGAFGRVYRCLSQISGTVQCVVKEVDIPRKEPGHSRMVKIVNQEFVAVAALKKLDYHSNIVRIFHCMKSEIQLHVFMENMEGGDLSSFIDINGKQSDRHVLMYLKQVATGLKFLHSHGIAHYDLKSNNILLDNDVRPKILKIADYGTSKVFSTGNATTDGYKGTPKFMAPEVCATKQNQYKKPEEKSAFNKLSEIWSLGIIGLHLITGELNMTGPGDVHRELNKYAKSIQNNDSIIDGLKRLLATNQQRTNPVLDVLKGLLVIDPLYRCDVDTAIKLTNKYQPKVTCEIFTGVSIKDKPEFKRQLINHFTNHHNDDNTIQVALPIIESFSTRKWFVVSWNNDDDVSMNGNINVKVDDRQHMFYIYNQPTWADTTKESITLYLNSIQWTHGSSSYVSHALNNHFNGGWECVISSNNDTMVYVNDIIVRLNNAVKFITVFKRWN